MTDVDASPAKFFSGAGEMRARCRAFDWSATPLGPFAVWPQSLRTAAGTVLATGFPCILLWGAELTQIYNDAYVPIIGGKHPSALGHGNEEIWPEVWEINGPIFERVLRGETVTLEDRLYPLRRAGPEHPPQDVYLTLSYSPVPDETGGVGGVIVTMFETTAQVAGRVAQAERDRLAHALAVERTRLEEANAKLQEQSLELELTNQQLQENAAELEAANEELQSTTEELAERTRAAEQAAAALAESEARHRLAVEIAEVGTWSWDMRTDAATFDARVRELFAFDRDDPWPRVDILATRVHPEDRERVTAALTSAADPAGPGRYDAEYRVVRPDGTERWAVAAGQMTFEGAGAARRPVYLVGTVIDVTERRRAEAALEESERQWRTLADAIPTLAWTARADGNLDWYNARWYEYTGTTPAEMEGWGWQSVHDPAELPRVLERWRASIATGEPFEMTFPLRGADGGFRHFLTRISPMRDAAGRVVRWFGTNTNVEAERLAREAAEEARARTERLQSLTAALAGARTVVEVAAVVVAEGAAATGARTAMLAARLPDEGAIEILRQTGLTPEMVARYAHTPLSAATPSAHCVRTGEPVWVDGSDAAATLRARFPDAAEAIQAIGALAVATVPLAAAGDVVGAISFTFAGPRVFSPEDREFFLTLGGQAAQALERARLYEAERVAREEAEAARERADAANQAKSEFLAAMSHELRTPLNAISGYVQLLDMGLRGPITDTQRTDFARIQRSQQHLLGLINDVLNFAKLESGHVSFDIVDVPVGALLDDLEALIGPQMRAKGLAYSAPECAESPAVRADPEKLRQVLLNVLTNAIKFTDAPGEIAVECETAAEATGAVVRVRVRDTGMGVPADKLEAIFEPFVQVDPGLTRAREGTGLGLSISRDLARRMGGDLTVESAPGVGSVFTLTLPRAVGVN